MKGIICLAGGAASGKTAIAQALADRLTACSIRSFGDIVRTRAAGDGLSLDRTTLQMVGSALIQEGWPSFVDAVLADLPIDSDHLIVDGIRHPQAISQIRKQANPTPVYLVVLQVDTDTVAARLRQRGESEATLTHESESHFAELVAMADLVIDTERDVSIAADRIINQVGL